MNKMPDEIYVFHDPKSIGDMGFTVTNPKDNHIQYVRGDLIDGSSLDRAVGRCIILSKRIEDLECCLLDTLSFLEKMGNPNDGTVPIEKYVVASSLRVIIEKTLGKKIP